MINNMIAYNKNELENYTMLNEAKMLFKSGILKQEQWDKIQEEYVTPLYTPTLIMRLFLFIITLLGMMAVMGPLILIFQQSGLNGIRAMSVFYGISLIVFTEIQLISVKKQFKSGSTEAGIFAGFAILSFGILGIESINEWLALILGFVITLFISQRYLNTVALLLSIGFAVVLIFRLMFEFVPRIQAFLPFLFMFFFALLYYVSHIRQQKNTHWYLNNHFIITKTTALVLFYLAGNYFVVRTLSENLLATTIGSKGDISGAYFFYFFTASIPIFYVYWGIKTKSILFIRVALVCLALSVITLKYYFSLGMPMVTITISGALLMAIALILNNYLKQIRQGFTREKILNDKWSSSNLMPFIASQTLGGVATNTNSNTSQFGDGQFGGGGASDKF